MGARILMVIGLVLVLPVGAWANDYGQGRGLSGGGVAFVGDHSAIELNPAGITQFYRYSAGTLFSHAGTSASVGLTVMDNKTSPFAMGVDYRNEWPTEGNSTEFRSRRRHDLTLAVGEFYEGKVHIGFSYKFRNWKLTRNHGVTAPTKKNSHNFTTGAIIPVNEVLLLGVVTRDIFWFAKNAPPPSVQVGAAVIPHEKVILAADLEQITDSYRHWNPMLSAELIAKETLALRMGWKGDFYEGFHRIGGGFGWIFEKGHISFAVNNEPGKNMRYTGVFEVNVM